MEQTKVFMHFYYVPQFLALKYQIYPFLADFWPETLYRRERIFVLLNKLLSMLLTKQFFIIPDALFIPMRYKNRSFTEL
jgi:hypothetical protein